MNSLWQKTLLLLILVLPMSAATAQTNYSVPLTVAINKTAINRVIADQWNESGFTKSWSGNQGGLSYSIQLEKPWIDLSTNTIQIRMPVVVNGTRYTINPTLTVPPVSIDVTDIITDYQNLRQTIDLVMSVADARLRDAVNNALAPIDWRVHKGKVMDATEVRFSDSFNVKMSGIPTLTIQVSGEELLFTATSSLVSTPPGYSLFQMKYDGGYNIYVKIFADNDLDLGNELVVYANYSDEDAHANLQTANKGYDEETNQYFIEGTYRLPDPFDIGANIGLQVEVVTKRNLAECLWRFPTSHYVGIPTSGYNGVRRDKTKIIYGTPLTYASDFSLSGFICYGILSKPHRSYQPW